jgi:hypothetical protein
MIADLFHMCTMRKILVLDVVPVVEAQLLADAGEGPLGGLALLHLRLLHTTAPHHTNMNITTIGSASLV